MLREIPSAAAFTVTAAGVLFNALAILSRPFFALAIVFIVLTSSLDHRTRFRFFLGISTPLLGGRLLETDLMHVKLQSRTFARGNEMEMRSVDNSFLLTI